MNTLLLGLIAIKAICLIICWRTVSMARRQKNQTNMKAGLQEHSPSLNNETSDEQLQELQERMTKLMEQNRALVMELQGIKQGNNK